MRLDSISLADSPPIARVEVAGLADVVALAGPNGVGKTRLLDRLLQELRGSGTASVVIRSTSPEENKQWGKEVIDLADPADRQTFLTTLQVARQRRNWRSSIVNFESDRSFANVAPLAFSWDVVDPEKEAVDWDSTFGTVRARFQDTVHSMFRMIEVQRQGISTRAVTLRRQGHQSMQLSFDDPMEPFKDVFHQLLGPKTLVDPSPRTQNLEYQFAGSVLPFSSLSSGEREVVTIAFDFLLRNPQDCITFFDEPELHLHPELSFRLIQTLQTIGRRNQFILSTHSPDIITASLDRSVVFVSPPSTAEDGTARNQAIPVDEADHTHQALRLLGHSIGIVALGRKIILIEGSESSTDKQTYGAVLHGTHPEMVLVPSGGKHTLESFEAVHANVLSNSIWGVEFFMLCDGDSRPTAADAQEAEQEGRLRSLPRYHLENYFLDETVWAEAFSNLEPEGSWHRDPSQIRTVLAQIARGYLSYAAALRVSHQLRQIGGSVDAMPKDCHGKSLEDLAALVAQRAAVESNRFLLTLDPSAVQALVEKEYGMLEQALDDGSWQTYVPGKPVLHTFANRAGLKIGHMKSLYIAAARQADPSPFADVIEIFGAFAAI